MILPSYKCSCLYFLSILSPTTPNCCSCNVNISLFIFYSLYVSIFSYNEKIHLINCINKSPYFFLYFCLCTNVPICVTLSLAYCSYICLPFWFGIYYLSIYLSIYL
ncbi:hypothetical protein XENTR_v10024564 [Xenopus tropicalis]|nr:hypothetical protein XENTR_v10024564 [Xenopus tropicalis]